MPAETLVLAAIPLPLQHIGPYWRLTVQPNGDDDPRYWVSLNIYLVPDTNCYAIDDKDDALQRVIQQVEAAQQALPDRGVALREALSSHNMAVLLGIETSLTKWVSRTADWQQERRTIDARLDAQYSQARFGAARASKSLTMKN